MTPTAKRQRDRRFEAARRRLHYRLDKLLREQSEHFLTKHDPGDCATCEYAWARIHMVKEIIHDFEGRA